MWRVVDVTDGDRRTMWRLDARRDDVPVPELDVAVTRELRCRRRRARRSRVSVVVQAMTMMTTTTPIASAPFPPKRPATPSPLRLDDAAPSSVDARVGTTVELHRESSTHSDMTSTSRFFTQFFAHLSPPAPSVTQRLSWPATPSGVASQQQVAMSKQVLHDVLEPQESMPGRVPGVGAVSVTVGFGVGRLEGGRWTVGGWLGGNSVGGDEEVGG